MKLTKVFISNLLNSSWHKEWIPIITAVIALITSVISLYWTRIEQIKSTRPFVWATNYGVVDNNLNRIIPIPNIIGCRVKNSPAKIIQFQVTINLEAKELFKYSEKNLVRFPDESSEWSFSIAKNDFDRIINRPMQEQSKLTRTIWINYSSLNGGKTYNYKLFQVFIPSENQWKDIDTTSD